MIKLVERIVQTNKLRLIYLCYDQICEIMATLKFLSKE